MGSMDLSTPIENNMPKVSVVMPVYNGEKMIANAIMSILNQTEQDFELIIINDASSDNTEEVVKQFKDERIQLTNLGDHAGLVFCRNFGNSLAEANVIAIQDADDLSFPRRLEICLKEIEDGVDVVVHGAYTNFWDTQYNCVTRSYIPPGNPLNFIKLLKGQHLTGWPVFRKEVWKKKPFRYETQFAYDWMMHIDWIFSGFTYQAVDEALYEYVRQENSASQVYEKDGRRAESMEKIKEILKNEYTTS